MSADSPITKYIGHGHHISTHEEASPQKLVITIETEYNIGASGSETIRFDVTPVDDTHTRITVNYKDSWYGIWPPFIFWNPGVIVKYRMINSLNNFMRERSRNDSIIDPPLRR